MAISKRSAALVAIVKWSAALIIFLCMFKVDFISDSTANDPVQWALLIGGGWTLTDSFAFEGDIAQTFDLLKAGGLKEENIVVFLYDKVEHNKDNPFRGKLRPGGQAKNYYAGLRKDYTGDDVTSMNILSVLSGNRLEVGNRKVISSSPRDTIFVVISGHGSASGNIVIGPNTELKKRRLMEVILSLERGRKFGSLLMYASSCHGSCVIQDIVFPEHSRIYVITSSKCGERSISSCGKFDSPTGKLVRICTLTDFSKVWIGHSHVSNRKEVEVGDQYKEISEALAKPVIGYIIGGDGAEVSRSSIAGEFGDFWVKNDKLERFQGYDHEWSFHSRG